jgi:hypothetical protein
MRSLVGHALDALSARGLRRSHQHSHDAAARLRKFFRRRCGRVVAGLTPASPLVELPTPLVPRQSWEGRYSEFKGVLLNS